MRKVDLIGKRYGRLVVLSKECVINNRSYYRCLCDCGNECVIRGSNLVQGNTQSCGCLHKELASKIHYKHGGWKNKLYLVWRGMKDRCNNMNHLEFCNYGGRGIGVCDEWKGDFKCFYDWAMSNGYKEGLTIDRIDNNGDYRPDNCRWVTMKVQQRNKRNNRFVKYGGKMMTISELAELSGVNYYTLLQRLNKGMSVEEAINR